MSEEYIRKSGPPTRRLRPRPAMTPDEQADLDAFRRLQPMSLRAVAKSLKMRIRPRTQNLAGAEDDTKAAEIE